MPLRDHFRPPVELRMSWESFHVAWPVALAERLMELLPEGYMAEPGGHSGTRFEVDGGGCELENWTDGEGDIQTADADAAGGTATAVLASPIVSVATELDELPEYGVRVYDEHRTRRLVAAVELVSPRNKDRAESRRALATKCAAFLQQGVSVCVVDLVTTRHSNIYAELSAFLNLPAPTAAGQAGDLYAVACRGVQRRRRTMVFQAWAHELRLGQPLPNLPLWLTQELWVPLELDLGYERVCRSFRLPSPPTSPPAG